MEKKYGYGEKPRYISAEKTILSETKDKLIVRIPVVVRFRPIVIQPQAITITFQIEDIRIAIRVGAV